jgi:hypothetical protein
VVRRQLGKGDKNKIRGIDSRAAYWAERVRLMQHWSDRLDSLRDGAPAVSLRRSACLALQLHVLKISESMGNHDSNIVDACGVD